MFSLKVEALFILAFGALMISVFYGDALGQFRLMLSFSGGVLLMAWAIGKGIDVGAPKFVAAKRRLILTLVPMGLGVITVSTGSLEVSVQPSNIWGLTLEILGTILFVAGIIAMILVLVITDQ